MLVGAVVEAAHVVWRPVCCGDHTRHEVSPDRALGVLLAALAAGSLVFWPCRGRAALLDVTHEME